MRMRLRGSEKGSDPGLTPNWSWRNWRSGSDRGQTPLLAAVVVATALAAPRAQPAAPTLDYETFKTKVQPIFLAKRPGHARCVSCHASGTPLRLQPLSPGAATWNEEQSRKNFDAVKRVVVPGSLKSMLLVHPLAEQAGG